MSMMGMIRTAKVARAVNLAKKMRAARTMKYHVAKAFMAGRVAKAATRKAQAHLVRAAAARVRIRT